MPVILSIDTATTRASLVLGQQDRILHHESTDERIEAPVWLRNAYENALSKGGLSSREIDAVAVNIGPGGLTSTRGGVTFANALAWGLGTPVLPLCYFDLLAAENAGRSVVCVRATTAGSGFAKFHVDGTASSLMFGNLDRILAQADRQLGHFVLSGIYEPAILDHLPRSMTGPRHAGAKVLHTTALQQFAVSETPFEPLEPVTSHSPQVEAFDEKPE